MMINLRLCFLFAGVSLLSACASPPPSVNAEVSLINSETKTHSAVDLMPESLWSNFNNAQIGYQFESDFGVFRIENVYISALGNSCVAFTLYENKMKNSSSQEFYPKEKYYDQDRRACKSSEGWFFISPIMKRNNGGVE